jgi:hypothetical protein
MQLCDACVIVHIFHMRIERQPLRICTGPLDSDTMCFRIAHKPVDIDLCVGAFIIPCSVALKSPLGALVGMLHLLLFRHERNLVFRIFVWIWLTPPNLPRVAIGGIHGARVGSFWHHGRIGD